MTPYDPALPIAFDPPITEAELRDIRTHAAPTLRPSCVEFIGDPFTPEDIKRMARARRAKR